MELRDYQLQAVEACWDAVAAGENPLLVLPCGAGKTPVGAKLLSDAKGWGGRAVLSVHVKELASQMCHKLQLLDPNLYPSICSASLGSHDADGPVVIGTIQTLVRRIKQLDHRDLLLVDEAHLLSTDPQSSYQKLVKGLKEINPKLAIVGMTATPWRLKQGEIWGQEGSTFTKVSFEIGIRELIDRGYLVPVVSKDCFEVDISQVGIASTGDYKEGELQAAFRAVDNVSRAVDDMLTRAAKRRLGIVFCTGKEHAVDVREALRDRGKRAETIFGDTPIGQRDSVVAGFRRGEFDYLVAVRCLTTGFDAPAADHVALMTSTTSPVLYSQMVGRVMRPSEGKSTALLLDYGGNAMRHGPVDRICPPRRAGERKGDAPTKRCPQCREVIFAGFRICPDPECGFEFPVTDRLEAIGTQADDLPMMTQDETPLELPILNWSYSIHRKPGKPPVLRVTYGFELYPDASEWIPFESPHSFGQRKARHWWKARSHFPVPTTCEEALAIARQGGLAKPLLARVKLGGQYPEVVSVEVDRRPPMSAENVGPVSLGHQTEPF
jgi:DNA repair protein RadD